VPVLSFQCVITRHDGTTQLSQRRAWIKGHDLRALAVAATEQLRLTPDQCEYMLFSPQGVPAAAGVFLEVVHAGMSALVGPMGGPAVPATLSAERTYRLDDLLNRAGFGPDADSRFSYPVLVTFAGTYREAACPLAREARESDTQYEARQLAAERTRLARARHEGIHLIQYDVPAEQWKASDLEMLMALAYRLLPATEPSLREAGCITQEQFAAPVGQQPATLHYCLEVARGDYAAYVRLPAFPTNALAEWLAERRCEISLRHPVMKIAKASRTAHMG
jgi:hypothetical protein